GYARQASFVLKGVVAGGANYMFNWNGFIARLFLTDPRPLAVFPLDVITAALVIKVWTRGDLRASWLATNLGLLLAMPHMLWYDWVLLLPAGLAFVLAYPSTLNIGLLAALHFSIN